MNEQPATLTVEELARYLHIGQNVAYRLVKKPGFPAIRVSPRKIIIPVKALEQWMESQTGNVTGGDE